MTDNGDELPQEALAERVETLWQELELAIQFDRPSILLAVYKSEFVRADVEKRLTERLQAVGWQTRQVYLNPQNHDLPAYLRQQEEGGRAIYFVSGLAFGGGEDGRDAYRALNIRREYFTVHRLRVLFWLTEQELYNLPRYAPDFWSFRHRTVAFMDAPDAAVVERFAPTLPRQQWQNDYTLRQDTAAKIAYRQRLLAELPDSPENNAARADLLYTLGTLYSASGEHDKVTDVLQQALTIYTEVNDWPNQAKLYNELGSVALDRGDYAAARPYFERALAIREKALGPDHPDTAVSLNNMGYLLDSMGELAAARPYYERALAIHEKALGPDHPDTAASLNNLGFLLQEMGELAAARPYYERALAIREKALGPDHPDTARSLSNLGGLLNSMGESAAARLYYERALAIREKVLGSDHPDTANSLNNLGAFLQEMGELAAARPYHERALEIEEKALGPDHPNTARSLNNLAWLCHDEGDKREAVRLMRRALAIREQRLGSNHPDTQLSRESLAVIEAELK